MMKVLSRHYTADVHLHNSACCLFNAEMAASGLRSVR